MLSEVSHDPKSLCQLQEVEDDDDESDAGVKLPTISPRIDHFTDTNRIALLRHAAVENARARQRTTTGMASASADDSVPRLGRGSYHGSVVGATDDVIEETEEQDQTLGRGIGPASARRFSEHSTLPNTHAQHTDQTDPRRNDDSKRPQWQSRLGFGEVEIVSQSRRHSLADVPTRRGSLNEDSTTDFLGLNTALSGLNRSGPYYDGSPPIDRSGLGKHRSDRTPANSPSERDLLRRAYAYSGLIGFPSPMRANQTRDSTGTSTQQFPTMRNMFDASQFAFRGSVELLYIIEFKCGRAEVYFLQEGNGLNVRNGDLVIVEADRGVDLGTVTHSRVSWSEAKEYKEKAAEQHYRWLMMFSRYNQANGDAFLNANGFMANADAERGSVVGGMGPPPYRAPASSASDIKPKLIKRLAQSHEIAILQGKEGNEAKAKRICQQKVAEMGLPMEILDAEWQVDWHKLTFYYYAEEYINFVPLVGEIFKIYKIRIWMSAINPTSHAPSRSLLPPSGHGPGAITRGRDSPIDWRAANLRLGQPNVSYGVDPDPAGVIPPNMFQNPFNAAYLSKTTSTQGPSPYATAFSQSEPNAYASASTPSTQQGRNPFASSFTPPSQQGYNAFGHYPTTTLPSPTTGAPARSSFTTGQQQGYGHGQYPLSTTSTPAPGYGAFAVPSGLAATGFQGHPTQYRNHQPYQPHQGHMATNGHNNNSAGATTSNNNNNNNSWSGANGAHNRSVATAPDAADESWLDGLKNLSTGPPPPARTGGSQN
ncbi:hypothetical protein LTR28_009936 [Elasticomyces elasticus]|nr:hypothetical protein LTR28_009936 [Elasticomyces elasticus]